MSAPVEQAARKAEANPTLRWGARAGYAANGVVHLLIGAIVVIVAFGGGGETDQAGAFKAIADAPLGFAVLWVVAAALCALGLWHIAAGIAVRRDGAKKWGVRAAEWGQAGVFIALGVIAASVALGAKPDTDEAAQEASRGVLTIPGGPLVLGLVGLGIGIGGVVFLVMGVLRSFRSKVRIPDGALGVVVTVLGVVGFLAKGVALVVLGILLLVAAATVDPEAAGGLDAAIRSLLDLAYGPLLVAAVGAGLLAYGVFCLFRARYARL